jgi:hydrogenase assembly chaperone HypC/HupF
MDAHFHCPTCSDEGLPARVLRVDAATNMARVQLENQESEVALDLVSDVRVGDFVLVHLDVAIAKLNASDVVEA